MRPAYVLPVFCAVASFVCHAQSHCVVQAAPLAATQADTAFGAGNFSAAESLYTAEVASSPSPVAFTGLVHSQLELSELQQASASAARAATALPKSGDALALEGDVLLRSGQIPEAFKAFQAALAVDPCSPHAHLGVARLDLIVSRGSVANHELGVAHALAPADPEVWAAYIDTLPETAKAAAIKALLERKPTLTPHTLTRLSIQLAALDQRKLCTATPYTTADLTMFPVMISGTYPRSWGLKANVNGADLPLLEMDTTVSGIVLNPKDAKKAGVHPLIPGSVSDDAPYPGYIDKIRIGAVEYHDCPVEVRPARELANLNSLIGLDFFRDHLIHIDYVTYTMSLSPLPVDPAPAAGPLNDRYIASDEKSWVPVYKVDHNLLVPTFVNKKGPFLFAIDTGSTRTIFAQNAAKAISCLHDSTLLFRGVSGPIVKVVPMDGGENQYSDIRDASGSALKLSAPDNVADLRWGGVDYLSRVPLCLDISHKSRDTGIELSGLIGFSDLSPFAIDLNYRDSLIHLKFDEMRRYDSRTQIRDH